MKGLGIDLCGIERIGEILARSDAFLNRYYSPEEKAYIQSRGQAGTQSAAAMYAAKEAFLKALGTGINGKIPLTSVGVGHTDAGAPYYVLGEEARAALAQRGIATAFLSLTHEEGTAAAVCVLE